MNVVFDADGVICIGAPFTAALEREHRIPGARLADFFATSFPSCLRGHADLKERLRPLLPTLGWNSTVDALLAFWFDRENVVCPDAIACVQSLRRQGHRCFLGTNQEAYRVAYMRKTMGFDTMFDGIFPSCEIGESKPAPAYFEEVRRRITCSRESLLLIDDSLRNVAAAKSAGWRTLHYRGVGDLRTVLNWAQETASQVNAL